MRLNVLTVRSASLGVVRFCMALLLVVFESGEARAQVYPVQATVQLTPPYSLYLADYVESGTERLVLNVFLADVARPQLDVRFRLKIIGQGITLETREGYMPPPVSIQGGMPLRLISTDLAEYFNPANLNFQGMSRSDYQRAGKLPEGVYQICFEVLEYNRGIKVSNTACGVAWMILNDPPIVNLPRQDEKLKAMSPQNVILQWTPRHTGSPNSAFTTEYDVTMVEVWPATRNPNDAILTSPPVFETTTTATTIIYGPAETPLEPGRRYAFRIKARSMAGVSQLDLFKNNGYSEVVSFVYGDACDLPTGISTTAITSTRFSIGWESLFNHTAYRVRYREAGTLNWYDNNIALNSVEIGSLKPGTVYEYQVAATCGFYDGQYSPITKVTTAPAPETEYSCGIPLDALKLDPALYTGSLKAGDIIMAGDFDVKVTKIAGSNGTYSGEGVIEVPYFNKARVKTEFSNITVNKDLRMINGYMNVTGAAVDVIPQGVTDFTDKLDEALDVADSALNKIENSLPQQFDPNSFVADTLIDVKNGIADVRKNDDGSVTVYDKNGGSQTIPAGTTAAIKDDNGNGYLVDKKGNIHKTTADVAAKAGNREYNLMLRFAANAQARYGFDEQKYDAITGYEKIDGYKVPWKAVASGGSDVITAALTGATDLDTRKIHFEQGGATLSASPALGKTQPAGVTLTGKSDGLEEGLLAVYAPGDTGKVQVLGKLNVVTYDEIQHTVVIVPVNGAKYPYSISVLRDSLNRIYGQAVVKWSVETVDPITVTLPDTFNDGGTGVFSNYTDDMKTVINAYVDNMDDEKFYLFLIGGKSSGAVSGYMPRSKQAGFIFVDQTGTEKQTIRTVAHELGHGAFNLPHTFKEERFTLPEKSTDNLMDYAGGQKLYKYQWDKMRYPDIVIGLFEKDEDAQSIVVMNIEALQGWEYNDAGYAFLSPGGEVVLLPKSVKNVKFSTGDIANSKDANAVKVIPFGTLISFNVNGITYDAYWSEAANRFIGYASADKKNYLVTENFKAEQLNAPLKYVIIGIPLFTESGISYRLHLIQNSFTPIADVTAKDYVSAGTFQNYDFLNSYFAKTEDFRTLSVPPSFASNQQAINFVLYYLAKSKTTMPSYGLYLYTHATLLDNYKLLGSCFASGLPGEFLRKIEPFFDASKAVPGAYPPIIEFPSDFELQKDEIELFDYLMSKWGDVDINYYKELRNLVDKFAIKDITAETDPSKSTEAYLKLFKDYYSLDTDNFDCLFSALSTDSKRNMLMRLMLDESSHFIWNDYESVIIKILSNLVNDAEVNTIFADLKKNPKYLYNAYQKLDHVFSGQYLSLFMSAILKDWKQTYSSLEGSYNDFKNLSKEDLLKALVKDPTVVLLEDEKLFTGTESDLILNGDWNEQSAKIRFDQTDHFLNSYGQMLFKDYEVYLMDLLTGSGKVSKKLSDLNPLDPVVIYITKRDKMDLGLQNHLDSGMYAVPAIFVYWVYKTKESEVNQFYLRVALDGVAVALAPVTGGGSLALITLEIAVPVIDIGMTTAKEQLSREDETFTAIYEYWDKAYMVYGVSMAGVGLIKAAPSVAGSVANNSRKVWQLIANPRLAGPAIKAKVFKNANDLREFITNIDKTAAAVAARYGAAWSTYVSDLRNLGLSLRINAELTYVSLFSKLDGYVNADAFLISDGKNAYQELFKYRFADGVQYASNVRFLRNSSGVTDIRFVGELDNIRYMDNGQELTSFFIVEDMANPGSFFAVTEREMALGVSGVKNIDAVVQDYIAFAKIDQATFRWKQTLYQLEANHAKVWQAVSNWEGAAVREKFVAQFGGNTELLTYLNKSGNLGEMLGTWATIASDYEKLMLGFEKLTPAQKMKFLADYAGSGSTVLSGLNSDVLLLDVWAELGATLKAVDAQDIVFLTGLKNIKSNYDNIWTVVKKWETSTQRRFLNDFGGSSTTILSGLNNDSALLEVWKDLESFITIAEAQDLALLASLKSLKADAPNVWGKVAAWEDMSLLKKFASQVDDVDVLATLEASATLDDMLGVWREVESKYSNIFSEFGKLPGDLKIRFFNEFTKEKATASLLSTLNNDAELFDAWKIVKVTGKFEEKEFIQALRFGKEHGGGALRFDNAEQGVEGVLVTTQGQNIPISFKKPTSNSAKNVLRDIKDNAKQIIDAPKAYPNGIAAKYCKFGPDANTYIRVDAVGITRQQFLDEYLRIDIPAANRRLRLGPAEVDVFYEIKIVFSDGREVVFINYNLQVYGN